MDTIITEEDRVLVDIVIIGEDCVLVDIVIIEGDRVLIGGHVRVSMKSLIPMFLHSCKNSVKLH